MMWGWLRAWRKRRSGANKTSIDIETLQLHEEITEAKKDWENALRHFEYAQGKDQIDYAIFAIEAAAKRYEMLLRRAKAREEPWPAWLAVRGDAQ